ncbi:MAG: hypothetical protein IKC55_00820, partial [Clostridia bacterium]|nr:hypothetical protein [Clostridia bacterium]
EKEEEENKNEGKDPDPKPTEKPTEKATERTTDAPEAAARPTEPAKSGCSSSISAIPAAFVFVVGALIGTAIIPAIKRKRD